MKSYFLIFFVIFPFLFVNSQVFTYVDKQNKELDFPAIINFNTNNSITVEKFSSWFNSYYKTNLLNLKVISRNVNKNGESIVRCRLLVDGIPVHDGEFVLHEKDGRVLLFNGRLHKKYTIINKKNISENDALVYAMKYINADVYKWEVPSEENFIKDFYGNSQATYYPNAEIVLLNSENNQNEYRIAYKFNIYAHKPLKRQEIYVDSESGAILKSLELLHSSDVIGTAVTKYSGTQTITTDSYSGIYRLRETSRGQGIETYNMQLGTDYGSAIDFTDDDNYWNNVNADYDEVAADAHWATEMTYDYYYNVHGRNSIDNSGFKLRSYVHFNLIDYGYSSNVNAFWDGEKMTYGDGNGGSITPLTTVDICGHEITHGLTTFTANLDYQDESGALNEAFSDIFGTSIEFYAKPGTANWNIGEDIGSVFRAINDPNSHYQPDTYLGDYWVDDGSDYGGVHTNSLVISYCFYLAAMGGSGVNDNGLAYSVNGIGMDKSGQIFFNALTNYLTNTSNFEDARFCIILSAIELFGACSPEVEAVTNAFYAVGIGGAYVPETFADFDAGFTAFCKAPAIVQFDNTSINGTSFLWNFGDGATSTEINPLHTYNLSGSYDVMLVADGGSCGIDTIVKLSFVSINTSNPCIDLMPVSGSGSDTSCTGTLYDSGGLGNYQNNNYSVFTIAPVEASSIVLTFLSFDFETGYDYLYIYDGSDVSAPLIGQYDGNQLPEGGTIVTSGGVVTIVQSTDEGLTRPGFELQWQCLSPNDPPVCNYTTSDSLSCTGLVSFTDLSYNNPVSWLWDFGDGVISSEQNPVHFYDNNGSYDVKLKVCNTFSCDSILKTAFVTINKPDVPVVTNDDLCGEGYANLTATGNSTIRWYDQSIGGSILHFGNTYTPFVNQTTTFYAENYVETSSQYTGKPDNSGDGGYFGNVQYVHYLVFDAIEPFELISVKVYADGAGTRYIALRNSSGVILTVDTVYIPDGESRVILNMNIPVGTDLQLVGLLAPNLYRNNAGVSFPYQIPNLVNIKKSSASTSPYDYYYYFYDWEVKEQECSSSRVPATVTVTPFQMPFTNDTVYTSLPYAADAGSGYETYNWFNGSALQTTIVNSFGWIWVTLTDNNGCTVTDSLYIANLTADVNMIDRKNPFLIYPNPSTDILTIDKRLPGEFEVKFFDAFGKQVISDRVNSGTYKINVSNFCSGVYTVYLQTGDEEYRVKFIKY